MRLDALTPGPSTAHTEALSPRRRKCAGKFAADTRMKAVELRLSVSPVKGGYGPKAPALLLLGQVNCRASWQTFK